MPGATYFWAAASMLTATLGLCTVVSSRGTQQLAAPLATIAPAVAGWNTTGEAPLDARSVERLNATSYLSRGYRSGKHELNLFVAYYTHQSAGSYMHSPKVCLPSSGWEIEQPGSVRVESPRGPVEINRYVIGNAGQKALVLYWYQSSTRIVADEYRTKLYLLQDGLLRGKAAGSIVRIVLPVDQTAERDAVRFAGHIMTELQRVLGS